MSSERTLFDAASGCPDVRPGDRYHNPITGTVWRVLHLAPRTRLASDLDRFAVLQGKSRRVKWKPRHWFGCLERV